MKDDIYHGHIILLPRNIRHAVEAAEPGDHGFPGFVGIVEPGFDVGNTGIAEFINFG